MEPPPEELASPATVLESDAVSNVLLLVPPMNPADRDGCIDLLTVHPPPEENSWSLGITLPPNHRVKHWENHTDESPGAFRIVSIGRLPQSHAEETAVAYGFDPTPNFVTLPTASDLIRIGISLTDALDDWESSDRHTQICFHSISALMQHTSLDTVRRFLETVTTHVTDAEASAHYHMDPLIHADAELEALLPVFDCAVRLSDQNEWRLVD